MYLRRFANDDAQVIAVPRNKLDQRVPLTVRNAATEVGFYAIPTDDLQDQARDGRNPEAAESALAGIEGACTKHIDQLLAGELPHVGDTARLHLSVFIALQHTRGWRFRRDLDDIARLTAPAFIRQNLTPEQVRAALIATGRPAEPHDVDDMFARLTGPDGPKPVLRKGMYVQHAFLNAIEVIAPTLFARCWRLLQFPKPCLLVSDEPVAIPNIPGKGAANVPELWFPLDRTHALQLTLRGAETLVHASLSKARKINTLIASQSERWIFHHPDDTPLDGLEITGRTGLVEKVKPIIENGEVVGELRGVVRGRLPDEDSVAG